MRLRVMDNLWIGDYVEKPYAEEFGAVMSLGSRPGTVDDGVAHIHVHLAASLAAEDKLEETLLDAVVWIVYQWWGRGRACLVRADPGSQVAQLVAACTAHQVGATTAEALEVLAGVGAPLTEDRLLAALATFRSPERAT